MNISHSLYEDFKLTTESLVWHGSDPAMTAYFSSTLVSVLSTGLYDLVYDSTGRPESGLAAPGYQQRTMPFCPGNERATRDRELTTLKD